MDISIQYLLILLLTFGLSANTTRIRTELFKSIENVNIKIFKSNNESSNPKISRTFNEIEAYVKNNFEELEKHQSTSKYDMKIRSVDTNVINFYGLAIKTLNSIKEDNNKLLKNIESKISTKINLAEISNTNRTLFIVSRALTKFIEHQLFSEDLLHNVSFFFLLFNSYK